MVEIKFCENNFSYGTDKLAKEIEENFKNAEVSIEPCLGYCGDCAVGPYALVNDELVQADTVEELYEKIKQYLR